MPEDLDVRELRELRSQLAAQELRITWLERMLLRGVVLLAIAGLLLSLLLPFFTAESDDGSSAEHLWLVQAVFALPKAGGGPFSSEAAISGILLGILLLATVLAIAALASCTFGEDRLRGWQSTALLLVILGTIGAWLFTAALAAHFEGGSLVGAGLLAHTAGSLLAGAAWRVKSHLH